MRLVMRIFAGEIKKDLLLEGLGPISGLWQLCMRMEENLYNAYPMKDLLKIRNAATTKVGLHTHLQLCVVDF